MYPELTNVLPKDRLKSLRRDYFIRLSIVGLSLVTVLVGSTGVLLLPTYVYLKAETNAREAQLLALESALASGDEAMLEARITTLTKQSTRLASLKNGETASAYLLKALAVPRPGIKISGFSFAPTEKERPSTLLISGVADTRDNLRAYQLAITAAPFVKSADLPISSYAKNSDISFSIMLALKPLP